MIYVKDGGFRLSAYLKRFDMTAIFADGAVAHLDDFGYEDACTIAMGHMIHDAWAGGVIEMPRAISSVALLRVEYRLFSYDGQGDPTVIEVVAPVMACGPFARNEKPDEKAKSGQSKYLLDPRK